MSQNLENFAKFQKLKLEILVDFEKCCKTHISCKNRCRYSQKRATFCRNFSKNWQLPYSVAGGVHCALSGPNCAYHGALSRAGPAWAPTSNSHFKSSCSVGLQLCAIRFAGSKSACAHKTILTLPTSQSYSRQEISNSSWISNVSRKVHDQKCNQVVCCVGCVIGKEVFPSIDLDNDEEEAWKDYCANLC